MTDWQQGLYPQPRRVGSKAGSYPLGRDLAAEMPPGWEAVLAPELRSLRERLREVPPGATQLRVRAGSTSYAHTQGYDLRVTPHGVELVAASVEGARYGLRTLRRMMQAEVLPAAEIADAPLLSARGVQVDLGRVIERPETVKRLLPLYADLNYNYLQLYFENAFVFPSHPDLARPWSWTLDQTLAVVEEAAHYGLEVIPAIQALGHCAWVGAHPDYAELDERSESGAACGVLCPTHPRTVAMLEDMVRDVAPLATSGIIHVGMDESFAIGCCSRCAPLREEIGEGGIFVRHANRMAEFARTQGKRPAMWGDMFYYYPQDLAALDKRFIIFDWYYYVFERYPRVELFGFPEMDTLAMWREQGLEAWGCPMSYCTVMMPTALPAESIENARSWRRYLPQYGYDSMMVTQWELAPTSIDPAPAIEGAIAGLLWSEEAPEAGELLRRSCELIHGRPQLGPLLEELGEARLHGHCALRWLRAANLAEMMSYGQAGEQASLAARLETIAGEFERLSLDALHPEVIATYAAAARWLAYQYRKRATLQEAAGLAQERRYVEARAILAARQAEAEALAAVWQERWDVNRHPEDPSRTPPRLREEAGMFAAEVAALAAAERGEEYAGELLRTVVAVHVVNTHPALPALQVETSPDGEEWTARGRGWILQFDSKAARPTSDEELTYNFLAESPEAARYVRVNAVSAGRFSLRGIALHRGRQVWPAESAEGTGTTVNAEGILHAEPAEMGYRGDLRELFHRLLAEGDSGRIYGLEHGTVVARMAVG